MPDDVFRISVRRFVEFVLRAGDIDDRRGEGSKEAMAEGSRIHRKLQKQAGSGYRAEVPLAGILTYEDASVRLEGRADGIFTAEDGTVTIDEIKGVYADPAQWEEPVPVHLAQAVCYAHLYAAENGCERMGVRVTYCMFGTEDVRYFERVYTAEELAAEVTGLMARFARFVRFVKEHEERRTATLAHLEFPFPYRPGQRDLAAAVYRTVSRGKRIFIQASTGIGKTMSVVFPAVKALGEGKAEKLFYLTARSVTRQAAEEAFRILSECETPEGRPAVSSVTVTAKEKLCFLLERGEARSCNPEDCPFAKGHFDRVNDAVYELISTRDRITREAVILAAEKYGVCPFELNLDVTDWTDAVVCDYNYAFDPNVRFKRYFGNDMKGKYVFLVDEAHNLAERAREMYSAELVKEDFLDSARHYKERGKRLQTALSRCNKLLLDMKKETPETGAKMWTITEASPLAEAAATLFDLVSTWYEEHKQATMDEEETEFFFRLRDFSLLFDGADENYRLYTEFLPDGKLMFRLFCVNPAKRLTACLSQGSAAVFFSATILPVRYFKSLLTGCEEDYAVYAPSPFDTSRRLLAVVSDVTTQYRYRSPRMYADIAQCIAGVTAAREGNYLVYFPSFKFLSDVAEELNGILEAEGRTDIVMAQEARMREDDREAFLSAFREDGGGTLIGLAVLGGIFSEGIDLTGERVIGVIVVGCGVPQVCTEREVIKDFYRETGGDGYAYAYRNPGMNKVMQAAGRLIRTDTDTGVIFLLDRRLTESAYQALFPREWADAVRCRAGEAGELARRFWEGAEHG